MRFLQIQRMTNCFQLQSQTYKLRQRVNVLFRLLSMCNNMHQNCLTVIFSIICLSSNYAPTRTTLQGGGGDSPFSFILPPCLSEYQPVLLLACLY